jgi:SSS family solute:Na+ symporter
MIMVAGFCILWWGFFNNVVYLMLSVLGWVTYRFRETRAMTLAQFFEMRYSRRFRLFIGGLGFGSALLGAGVYPQIGAKFFVYFCGLPETVSMAGRPVSLSSIITLSLMLFALYTILNGQVGQMLTDFIEGFISQICFVVILLFLFWQFPWSQVTDVMAPLPAGHSMLDPFDSGKVKDFNVWYFAIQIFVAIYSRMAVGSSGVASSASPHENRMGMVINTWRSTAYGLILLMVPVMAYVVLNHPAHAGTASLVQNRLAAIGDAQVRQQMTVMMTLSVILPVGLKGLFCAVLFAGFIGSVNSAMCSIGTGFVQDVVVPLRGTHIPPAQHMRWLRYSVATVATIMTLMSLFWRQNEFILMFLSGAAAVFTAGVGAVIIGGLYWRRGTTVAAWTSVIAGSSIMTAWMLVRQFLPADLLKELPNSQRFSFGVMLGCAALYTIVSLVTCRKPVNLEQLLHRGLYASKDGSPTNTRTFWGRLLGFTSDFTRTDRILVYATLAWTFGWFFIAVYGTIRNAFMPFGAQAWSTFWMVKSWIGLVLGIITTIWVSIGGFVDLRYLLHHLSTDVRDTSDDGLVESPGNGAPKETPAAK